MENKGDIKTPDIRDKEEVLEDIKTLIRSKGYIYAFCMILFEDFHVVLEKSHEIDHRSRISTNEASLLLGFLIQSDLEFSTPDTPQALIILKQQTYSLLEELHRSFMLPFYEGLEESMKKEHKIENIREEQKAFFGKGSMLTEPIFYSGTGVYDLQYLDFLEKKYRYDKEWLKKNKQFDLGESVKIVTRIKEILNEKSEKVHLYMTKEKRTRVLAEMKEKHPNEDWDKFVDEVLPMMEIHQYVDLFFEYAPEKYSDIDEMREEGWKSFYKGLIELFVIRKTDFEDSLGIDSFLNNFSIAAGEEQNTQFSGIGSFNWFNAKPIIQLDNERYFVPISFSLFEAVYESPFYWMWKEDETYRDQLGKNRGKTGEEIAYDFLSKVFGNEATFKSVKVVSKKGHDDTDIDVLCVLGSKALCVQVKSKKLTELARMGNEDSLQKDFQLAVQEAYEQGITARQRILEGNAKFYNEQGVEIQLSEEIDDVYIMGVTTENYPSLTHQTHVLLEKEVEDPFPMFVTVFDLELIAHYLRDPFDFLYYIKQRTSLMDYFIADEEMVFLGYHLDQKLWRVPRTSMYALDNSFGQLIDRNYYPKRMGADISDEGDAIKNRWKNKNFDRLCDQLKELKQAKITDIVFHLLDWSGDARDSLVEYIIKTKDKTLRDGKSHNFSIPPDNNSTPRVGVTYVSLDSDDGNFLRKKLLGLCQVRKYKSKGDVWIGFGSVKSSPDMIDLVVFNDQKWEYDKELEELSKYMLEGDNRGTPIRIGRKIGRNERCPCGSGLKYKKCCGQ